MFPGDSHSLRAAEDMLIGPDTILVTGPMSSGTRLMHEIVRAGGFDAVHDGWHGTVPRPAQRVIVMVRHPHDTRVSRDSAFAYADRIPRETSLAGCLTFYPHALWFSYEQLCFAPDATIALLAAWLHVEPWPMPKPIVHSNNAFYGGNRDRHPH